MGKLKAVAIGALGGLAGAALMRPLHKMTAKRMPQPKGEDATEKAAKGIVRRADGQRLSRLQRQRAGMAVHLAFGAGMGALYGLFASTFPRTRIGSGALFGAAVYLGAHAMAVPALGLAPSPVMNGIKREGVELASHLAYGVVTETVRRVLA